MGFKYEEDRTFIVCPRDKVEIVVNGKVYGADAEVRVQLRPTELYHAWCFNGKFFVYNDLDRKRYPENWEKIAFAVKESSEWKCQKCGKQCRKPGEPFDTHKRTLTVAHLNHTPEDVRPENLMAMCAPCHLRYDAKQHAETRRRKRNDKSRSS